MHKSVLVTGGLGFMGSDFVRLLDKSPHVRHIRVLDNFGYAADPELVSHTRAEVVNGDIRDSNAVHRAMSGIDLVVNFAAESHNDNSLERPFDFFSTNVDGVITLLQEVRRTGAHFHQVSTDEVFGDLPLDSRKMFTENSRLSPSSPYSASKASAEHVVRAWTRTFGISSTISNSANNYGPGQHREKFIPRMLGLLQDGKPLELYGDGRNVRDWIHVRDHSHAVLKICDAGFSGAENFLVSAEQEFSNLEIARMMTEIAGLGEDMIMYVQDRPGHDRRYSSCPAKLKSELNWAPVSPRLPVWLRDQIGKDGKATRGSAQIPE